MHISLSLVFIIVFVCLAIHSSFKSARIKKMVINEEVSKEFEDKAYELLIHNPSVSIARFKYKLLGIIEFGLFIAMIMFFGLCFIESSKLYMYLGIISLLSLIIAVILRKSNALFKEIIPKIISSYKEGLTYEHDKGIPSNEYAAARFERWDSYHSEDLIKGKINGCDFIMGEVHTQARNTDSDGNTYYATIFRGTFAVIDLNKDFGSWMNIVSEGIKLFSRDNYVALENTEFEKIYDVFAEDKIKALRLLTPDVTTKMIDLYDETGLMCEIKISNNKMYIRLYTSGLFELGFSNPRKEAKGIGRCIAVIDNVFKVTENFINELERLDD